MSYGNLTLVTHKIGHRINGGVRFWTFDYFFWISDRYLAGYCIIFNIFQSLAMGLGLGVAGPDILWTKVGCLLAGWMFILMPGYWFPSVGTVQPIVKLPLPFGTRWFGQPESQAVAVDPSLQSSYVSHQSCMLVE